MNEVGFRAVTSDRSSPKYGCVLTLRHVNNDRIGLTFGCVILLEFRAQAPGLNPDNGIRRRIERVSAIEDIDTQRVLVERTRIALQRLLDYVAEKPAQARGFGENRAPQYPS
jgi:hypothetical protein